MAKASEIIQKRFERILKYVRQVEAYRGDEPWKRRTILEDARGMTQALEMEMKDAVEDLYIDRYKEAV